MNHCKILKRLSKPCPDCEGKLFETLHTEDIGGVTYDTHYIECECGYCEKIKKSSDKIPDEFNQKWS